MNWTRANISFSSTLSGFWAHLAWVQATLSQGKVFRGRSALLRQQLIDHFTALFSLAGQTSTNGWFLSDVFFESVAVDPQIFGLTISDREWRGCVIILQTHFSAT